MTLFTALALGQTAAAQGAVFLHTGDGNPFLLVPIKTHTVHWLNLHPARLEDEPTAYPDLALAIARSSLLGEARPGGTGAQSKKPNPLEWEEALRRAPTLGSRLVRVDDHVGVSVTFPARSIGPVALLMRMRTHRTKLHRIAEHYLEAKSAREARLARTPDLELLRRALDAADPKRKLGSMFVRGGADHIDENVALQFYRWNCQPARAINILVGGFDTQFVTRVLNEVFLKPTGIPKRPESHSTNLSDVRSSVATSGDTLMVVYPFPAGHPAGLDLLVELLAGDSDAYLPDFLRANGHARIRVQARARFPHGGRMLLLQATQPDLKLGTKSLLPKHVEEALARIAARLPADSQVQRAIVAQRSRRSRQLADQEGLAESLALCWVRGSVPDPKKLTPPDPAESRKGLQALAKNVLASGARALVTPDDEAPK